MDKEGQVWRGHVALHMIYAREHKYRVLATCKLSLIVECHQTIPPPFALPPFMVISMGALALLQYPTSIT